MDVSKKNRQINQLQYGDLILFDHPQYGLQVHKFLKVDHYVRSKAYCFNVQQILGKGMMNEIRLYRYDLQNEKTQFIDENHKQYKALKVLYSSKDETHK